MFLKITQARGFRTTTGGKVTVGICSHIEFEQQLKNNIIINDHSVIGAKSLVLKNCEKKFYLLWLTS